MPAAGGRQRCRHAFTLIELLAVISLIVLLMSLLLPVMGRAKDKANQVSCMSNVRQVTAAIIINAGDNKGRPVDPNWKISWDGREASHRGWLYSSNQWTALAYLETGVLWPYLGDYYVYRCPAHKVDTSYNDTRVMTSYNMNGSVCAYPAPGVEPGYDYELNQFVTFTVGQFRPSDIVYWEGDETKNAWNDGANYPNEGISSRHFGYGTIACFDGHVQKLSQETYVALANATTNNNLRNTPFAANGIR